MDSHLDGGYNTESSAKSKIILIVCALVLIGLAYIFYLGLQPYTRTYITEEAVEEPKAYEAYEPAVPFGDIKYDEATATIIGCGLYASIETYESYLPTAIPGFDSGKKPVKTQYIMALLLDSYDLGYTLIDVNRNETEQYLMNMADMADPSVGFTFFDEPLVVYGEPSRFPEVNNMTMEYLQLRGGHCLLMISGTEPDTEKVYREREVTEETTHKEYCIIAGFLAVIAVLVSWRMIKADERARKKAVQGLHEQYNKQA